MYPSYIRRFVIIYYPIFQFLLTGQLRLQKILMKLPYIRDNRTNYQPLEALSTDKSLTEARKYGAPCYEGGGTHVTQNARF